MPPAQRVGQGKAEGATHCNAVPRGLAAGQAGAGLVGRRQKQVARWTPAVFLRVALRLHPASRQEARHQCERHTMKQALSGSRLLASNAPRLRPTTSPAPPAPTARQPPDTAADGTKVKLHCDKASKKAEKEKKKAMKACRCDILFNELGAWRTVLCRGLFPPPILWLTTSCEPESPRSPAAHAAAGPREPRRAGAGQQGL